MNLSVTVKNDFGKLTAAAIGQIDRAVRKAAFDIEREAKQRAPVDTGFLRASIYTVTKGGSGFKVSPSGATGAAQRTLFSPVSLTDSHEAIVAVGAQYGIYLEYGTRRSPAQPFMTPAVMKVKPKFEADIARALEGK